MFIAQNNVLRVAATLAALMQFIFTSSCDAADTSTMQQQFGVKYSPLAQINTSNVDHLQLAWEFHTGEVGPSKALFNAFEDEPTLVDGNLVVCTPTRRLIALDPVTGNARWTYDPKEKPAILEKCRGILAWVDDQAPADAECKTRIFLGTADYRLIAIDAKNGKPCSGFGVNGEVQMQPSKPEAIPGEVAASSRPAIVNGIVVVGSAVMDDVRLNSPSGRVLAFDARSGKQVWEFDPLPRSPSDPAAATWVNGTAGEIGGSNVWANMAVDESLDLVYLPTSGPSIDFYGAARPGAGAYGDSVVALQGATGKVVWYHQLVHHDLWDYDTPSQPILVDLPHNGETVPALVQNTKMGLVFVFNRKTGEPLFPIEERPVPQQGAVPGEWLSPTQPFPVGIAPAMPHGLTPDDAWGFTPIDRWLCKRKIAKLNYGPLYTPPSEQGSTFYPTAAGGANWGGGAYDPKEHLMVVATNRVAMSLTMIPRENKDAAKEQMMQKRFEFFYSNGGGPYLTKLEGILSPLGAPCSPPPWAALTAIDLVTGAVRWEVPLGSIEKEAPVPIPLELGEPGAGGPLITAGGLVFIGYANDDKFRAFDLLTGKTAWKTKIPFSAMSTPVTYEMNGEQFVVVAAGGHSVYHAAKGDAVVAYKLTH